MGPSSPRYRAAGVDIDESALLVERLKPLAAATRRAEVLTDVGGFAGLFRFPAERYRDPVLVAGTDGVGTKLKLALDHDRLDGLGHDLVAMCANDVAVTGAEPLFFLDYFATGRLNVGQAERLVAGIAAGCREAGCALIGGETAELPGLYSGRDFDLAGFCVGAVERNDILDGNSVCAGDSVVGVASSGPHSNGYSLIRRILVDTRANLAERLENRPLLDWLMEPTIIYVRAIRELLSTVPVKALAHITGGGIIENLPRVLPTGLSATVDTSTWAPPAVFDWLAKHGHLDEVELFRVFNMGVGLAVVVSPSAVESVLAILASLELHAWPIGIIARGAEGVTLTHR